MKRLILKSSLSIMLSILLTVSVFPVMPFVGYTVSAEQQKTAAIAPQVTTANIDKREYTDKQLADMLKLSAEKLKTKINTRADARAFLDLKFPELWHSYHTLEPGVSGSIRSGEEILNDEEGFAGRSDIATTMTYLLSDNAEIGSLYGFWYDDNGEFEPIKAANYIILDGKCIVFDPVVGMKGDNVTRYGELFPEKTVDSLKAYIDEISLTSLGNEVGSIYAVVGGQSVTFTDKDMWITVVSPVVDSVYTNEDNDMTNPLNIEKRYGHIKAENINQYQLSKILGGITLSVSDAKVLVGKTPEEIKTKVNTAGDMLMYMLAARLLLKNGDDTIFTGGYEWHYNATARTVLSENLGNCGRMANLANFLLEGDYQEIGFILHSYHPDNGGGHVYNYIKYQNKYYIIDFSSYLFNNYNVESEFNIIALDKLDDYGKRWNECYSGLAAIIAHTSTGTHLPNVWDGDGYYFPSGAKFKVLFETPGKGYKVKTMKCPSDVPDWRNPQ